MITIIHGDNVSESRKFLNDQKKLHAANVSFDGEKVTLTDVMQVFSGGGLFSQVKTVFIDRLFTKFKSRDELDAMLAFLSEQQDANVYIWEGKEITKSITKKIPHATLQSFKLPSLIFQFLDSLTPGNSKTKLALFHCARDSVDVEMIFAMLVRQVRILLAVKSNSKIDEVARLSPWQRSKFAKQADAFTLAELKSMHSLLFNIDKEQKTGVAKQDLTSSIDFFLLAI